MTAYELIRDIFSRYQAGVPGNARCITRPQLELLRKLIAEDPEGRAVESSPAEPGYSATVWLPAGRNKYILTEDLQGKRHRLTRLANVVRTDMGRLF